MTGTEFRICPYTGFIVSGDNLSGKTVRGLSGTFFGSLKAYLMINAWLNLLPYHSRGVIVRI